MSLSPYYEQPVPLGGLQSADTPAPAGNNAMLAVAALVVAWWAWRQANHAERQRQRRADIRRDPAP